MQANASQRKPSSTRYKVVSSNCELRNSNTYSILKDGISIESGKKGKAFVIKKDGSVVERKSPSDDSAGDNFIQMFIESDSLVINSSNIGGDKKFLYSGRSADTSLSDFGSNLTVHCESEIAPL